MQPSVWSPRQVFSLAQVLESGALGPLRVGAAADEIEPCLGPAELPPARLSRRSKIWSHVYGNVTLLVSSGRIDAIQIDYEGVRPRMVEPGHQEGWRMADWQAFATQRGWEIRTVDDVVWVLGGPVILNLRPSGALQIVSLRGSPGTEGP